MPLGWPEPVATRVDFFATFFGLFLPFGVVLAPEGLALTPAGLPFACEVVFVPDPTTTAGIAFAP